MKDEKARPGSYSVILHPCAFMRAFRHRSDQLEHIDKGDYTPEEYEGCMVELRRVNRFMGDSAALRRSLNREESHSSLKDFSVLDVGAGTGELLRVVAYWARKKGKRARLVGLELNARSADGILERSKGFPEINAIRGDALRLPFVDNSFELAICSLFTHHLTNEEVIVVLRELGRIARRRILVIDLFRHPLAYLLYTTVGRLVLYNRLLREDGALSILRSFSPGELKHLAVQAKLTDVRVERRFPFRLVLSATGSREEVAL